MSAPVHVMLDLETWGTAPGCDIRSIGAVVFDPQTGRLEDEFYLAVENPILSLYRTGGVMEQFPKFKLTRDPATVAWWAQQSDEARGAFADPTDLDVGLQYFATWFRTVGLPDSPAQTRLWSLGPHFDEAILAACYRAVGLPVPWHYRAPRDCRTLWDLVGGVDLPFDGTAHNALDDARHQARCVCEAYRRLGLAVQPDNRVSELLAANNRAVEKRREAVALLREAWLKGDCESELSGRINAFLTHIHWYERGQA